MKFNINYIFLVLLVLGYLGLIMFCKIDININIDFGFVLNIKEMLSPTLVYLIIIAGLTVFTLLFIDKPYSNNFGMRMLLVSLIVVILEYVCFIGGAKVFPYPIIGEIFILICAFYALETFKTTKKIK
ncbi:MAG: hypothetical protein ACRDA5_03070 [Clostridium sp.]